jgi:AmiR/NasT family two-component response regulator
MHDTPDATRRDAHAIATPSHHASDLDDTEKFILEMLVRLDEADSQAENLKRALEHSRGIGAAIGIIMAFKKMTQDEAFDWLRRASQDQNRKLYDMAQDIVATGDCDGVASPSSEASSA